jgi:hypothetical protein
MSHPSGCRGAFAPDLDHTRVWAAFQDLVAIAGSGGGRRQIEAIGHARMIGIYCRSGTEATRRNASHRFALAVLTLR